MAVVEDLYEIPLVPVICHTRRRACRVDEDQRHQQSALTNENGRTDDDAAAAAVSQLVVCPLPPSPINLTGGCDAPSPPSSSSSSRGRTAKCGRQHSWSWQPLHILSSVSVLTSWFATDPPENLSQQHCSSQLVVVGHRRRRTATGWTETGV